MGPIIKKPRSFIGKRYIGPRHYLKIVEILPWARGAEGFFFREVAEVGLRQGFGIQRLDRRKSKAAILNEKWRCRYTALEQGTVEKATGHCLLSASQGYHTWGTKFYDPVQVLNQLRMAHSLIISTTKERLLRCSAAELGAQETGNVKAVGSGHDRCGAREQENFESLPYSSCASQGWRPDVRVSQSRYGLCAQNRAVQKARRDI